MQPKPQSKSQPESQPKPQSKSQAINDWDEAEIRKALTARGEPGYRAKQICEWLYRRRAKSFDKMTNLPAALRAELAKSFSIIRLELEEELVSPADGATKVALRLGDGKRIEAVYLPHGRGATLCISTQVGCAFRCRFCATGTMRLRRNLTPGEIVDQVLFAKEHFKGRAGHHGDQDADEQDQDLEHSDAPPAHPSDEPPEERPFSNVVMMGMGEPLANYGNVVKAVELLITQVGIGARRITISTAGVADKIMRLAELPHEVGLAISLNAPSDEVRRDIMPVAARTPLAKLIAAAKYYAAKKGRMPTFEYVLLPGLNDSLRDAYTLANITRDVPAKINLIPFNPFPGAPYERPDETKVKRFQSVLRGRGKKVMLRKSLGCDILAGCGQLGRKPAERRTEKA
jgi:23S rRNA (adenine2503-C2)-methyltransferase